MKTITIALVGLLFIKCGFYYNRISASKEIFFMKPGLRILGILLAVLFLISMVGCGTDTEDVDGATVVDIPDAHLRAAIASELEIQDDTSITVDDMLKLTYLVVPSEIAIVNLTGLEYATNLKELYLSGKIVDVSPSKNSKI